MKIFIKVMFLAMILSFTVLFAENNHNKEHNHNEHESCNHDTLQKGISNNSVKEIAIAEVKRLALNKKIPKSWKYMPVAKMGKTHYGDTNDWVVVFNNPKIKKTKKQNLYIFINIHGKIRGANYTGK